MKPDWSTRSCQIAIALRPTASAATTSSRYGSQALARGARDGPESVDTGGDEIDGFTSRSVDTSSEMAAFAGNSPGRPRPRTGRPAARRYRAAVSRRTSVASAIRLTVQPRRPSATICCCVVLSKTLPILTKDTRSLALVNASGAVS